MVVRGADPNDPDNVECDWFDEKGLANGGTYHEDQLEEDKDEDHEDQIIVV